MAEHAEESRHHGHPFGELMAGSSPLAVDDHVRVDADGRVVDENLAVDLGEIDDAGVPRGDRRRRFLDLQGDAEVFGEMIERAEREHAERHVRPGKHACQGADAAIASAHDNGVYLAASGLRQSVLRSPAQSVAVDEPDLGRDVIAGEGVRQRALDVGGKRLTEGAGAAIHDGDDPSHRDRHRRL